MIRSVFVGLTALVLAAGCASTPREAARGDSETNTVATNEQDGFTEAEINAIASEFFGPAAEGLGQAVARTFAEQGSPVGYIRGEEAAGAIGVGLRYGKGELTLRNGATREVYWQGPSIGLDTGANASKVFTLVYNLREPDQIYQRFPGVSGSAYFIGGVGVNYQQNEDIVLAPMRAGVGLRAGVNVGYLHYTRERQVLPL